jgi:glucosamine-6-phosphate deaminase
MLTENTIKDNARFFQNDINKVPKKAITMGIKNILSAETIILIANGKNKANAIKNIMKGVADKNVPASALNLHKGKVYVIVDKDAASLL